MRAADRSRRKIAYVTLLTSLVTGLFGLYLLVRSTRPSVGKPYEQLQAEEAQKYMRYETAYTILDIRDPEDFRKAHLTGAVNLPYGDLVRRAYSTLKDHTAPIYVVGYDEDQACRGAQKLSDAGYTGVAEIGAYGEWQMMEKETETESLMGAPID